LPGYGTRNPEEAFYSLLKICRNYFKATEEYEELRMDLHLPRIIRENYEEALVCFLNDLYNASCVMCGRTLEGALTEIGIMKPGMPLHKAIQMLTEKGLLFVKTVEAGDKIRLKRNTAAHFTEILDTDEMKNVSVDEATAREMLSYLRHCLKDLHPFDETMKKLQKQ
jgi:hypothetical protein